MSGVIIAQVSIKRSDTNWDLITLHQFLKIPPLDRNTIIREQGVEFIDGNGDKIKLIDALKSITELIKRLREDNKFYDFINGKIKEA